eukprot:1663021-Rhodomonas_salina.1
MSLDSHSHHCFALLRVPSGGGAAVKRLRLSPGFSTPKEGPSSTFVTTVEESTGLERLPPETGACMPPRCPIAFLRSLPPRA